MAGLKSIVTTNVRPYNEKIGSGLHETSPQWVVAFIRYENPASAYSRKGSLLKIKPLLVVQDDCIQVNIENNKHSVVKSCNLMLKSGDVYYTNAVANGDWCLVWVHDDPKIIEQITKTLLTIRETGQFKPLHDGHHTFNDWHSGLKFVGRVTAVSTLDTVAFNGTRTIIQQIRCDAFSELFTTIYFTPFALSSLIPPSLEGQKATETGLAIASAALSKLPRLQYDSVAQKVLLYLTGKNDQKDLAYGSQPNEVIHLLMIWLFGINKKEYLADIKGIDLPGSFNDAIMVPKLLAQILNIRSASSQVPLYQLYNAILGLQRYYKRSENEWENFSPISTKVSKDFSIWQTGIPLKGSIFFKPPIWTATTIWQMFQQYLNSMLNEMYTCFRCDQFNRIKPTIVVREQPFSTGLFNALLGGKIDIIDLPKVSSKSKNLQSSDKKIDQNQPDAKASQNSTFTIRIPKKFASRAMYYNLPRWVIDESMIQTITITTNDGARVNFVQVFSNPITSIFFGPNKEDKNSAENARLVQIASKNYVIDENDVKRNGLRQQIFETDFDSFTPEITFTPYFARIKADHLFNGHLKPSITLECRGIVEPICEGDNMEVRGVVYHIQSVKHVATLTQNGTKEFRTILVGTDGILASSLTSPNDIPQYPSLQKTPEYINQSPNIVGATDYERNKEGFNK